VLPGDFAILHGLEAILRHPLPKLRRLLESSLRPPTAPSPSQGT
jgi:hypothetical protein